MAQRPLEIGEKVKVKLAPPQREPSHPEYFLVQYEGLVGEVVQLGDKLTPYYYKVNFPDADLPALICRANLMILPPHLRSR
jgi:hypothetical protein